MRSRAPLAPDDPRHGTLNGYGNLRCRCDRCREANTIHHRAYVEKYDYRAPGILPRSVWRTANEASHGTESRYTSDLYRCRCELCREAAAEARRERRRRVFDQTAR